MAKAEDRPANGQRNGNLKIPLPFDEALKAATETKPPEEPKKAQGMSRAKKVAKK